MTYHFIYPTEWHNGILVKCNECKLRIFDCIEKDKQVGYNPKFHRSSLAFIIKTIYTSFEGYYDYPLKTKSKVIETLIRHQKFDLKEIEEIFEENLHYTDYTPEWEENASALGFTDKEILWYNHSSHKGLDIHQRLKPPINYSFGVFPCYTKIECGLCTQIPEEVHCDSCNISILNSPDYIDGFFNLVCPSCEKILKKSGIPFHHGDWREGPPLIEKVSTDYLATYHPNCINGKDGYGEMYPIGLWVERARLIIHFKCIECGYEDVLKYFIKEPNFLNSIYSDHTQSNFAQLKKVHYRTYDLLEGTESKTLEFKSSFYGLNDNRPPSKKSIKIAKTQIVDEILGFLNSDGGTLLIGIEKDKNIGGIEKDLQYIRENKKGHLNPPDYLILELKDMLLSSIEKYALVIPHIKIEIENLPTKECVVIIDVSPVKFPIFNHNQELIVNANGAKKYLSKEEASDYIAEHFMSKGTNFAS